MSNFDVIKPPGTDEDVIAANEELRKLKCKRPPAENKVRDASEKSPFMSKDQLLEIIPISRSTLYLLIRKGRFPKPVKFYGRAAAWVKKEVDDWIKERMADRD